MEYIQWKKSFLLLTPKLFKEKILIEKLEHLEKE